MRRGVDCSPPSGCVPVGLASISIKTVRAVTTAVPDAKQLFCLSRMKHPEDDAKQSDANDVDDPDERRRLYNAIFPPAGPLGTADPVWRDFRHSSLRKEEAFVPFRPRCAVADIPRSGVDRRRRSAYCAPKVHAAR